MKKLFFTLLLLSLSVFTFAQITGSAHDFSAQGWSGNRICIVCHTPHNANLTVAESPLWNHEVTVATYMVYSSGRLDAGPLGQPDGMSKLCLSCHDGTVALDSFGGNAGATFITPGPARTGTNLQDDHPISCTYDAALATLDGGLHDPATSTPLGGTIATDLLFSGRLECASCHDVHNRYGLGYLLKITANASTLCLVCHDK